MVLWFKCNSTLCKGDPPVILRYNELDSLVVLLAINVGKCGRCRCTGVIELINPDDYNDPYAYQYWDRCCMCDKWRLVSSGTGSCKQCDM